jgi:hypothetical protein
MSRRRLTEEPTLPVKPKKPPKPTQKELQHAQIEQAKTEARTFAGLPFPYSKEHLEIYLKREKELLTLYKANPGKCPICSRKVGQGIIGHISKCLRTQTSNSELPKTT